MRVSAVLAVLATGLSAALSAAADPPPAPTPPPPTPYVVVPWGGTNRYAAWQNYGVDALGRWRPRVLYTPDGAYYYYNGRPFPYMTTHPLEFMPHASD